VLPWIHRTGVAAAHRDDHVGRVKPSVSQRFGKGIGKVKAHLGHRPDYRGVDLIGRGRACRPYCDVHLPHGIEQGSGDL
jgi:hypothetical protein